MPGSEKTYMFHVPPDSPMKFGPPSFRPTIRVEGKYVAFATAADAARGALEAARKKDWKPSADVAGALANMPAGAVMLMLNDPRDTEPGLLASLPGTLQAQINTMIALANQPSGAGGNNPPGAAAPRQAGPGAGAGLGVPLGRGKLGGPGEGPGRPMSGFGGGGPPSGFGGGGPPPGYGGSGMMMMNRPGGQGPQSPGGSRSAEDAMVQLKVDPAKLPKAEDLKVLMFPTTLAVAADERTIRIVTREAFPEIVGGAGGGAAAGAILGPVLGTAWARLQAALPVPAAPAQPQPGGQAQGPGGFPPGFGPQGAGGPMMRPGASGGMGRGRRGGPD
jgi:hypothetical protein